MSSRAFWYGAALLLVICAIGVQVLRPSYFSVDPTQGALVLDRKGRVLREATIGLNQHNPFFETVWTARVTYARTVRIEDLWSTEDCTLDGRVVWDVDNLIAYYEAQGTGSVAQRIAGLASAVAQEAPAPFGLEADARDAWGIAFQDAVKARPELAGLGVRVIYANPLPASCATL